MPKHEKHDLGLCEARLESHDGGGKPALHQESPGCINWRPFTERRGTNKVVLSVSGAGDVHLSFFGNPYSEMDISPDQADDLALQLVRQASECRLGEETP